MTGLYAARIPRTVIFLVFNGAALGLFVALFVGPLALHFASRNEDIRENVAQLAYFQRIARRAQAIERSTPLSSQPFLVGGEERVVSADLQAELQAVAMNKGAHVLGIRGLQGGRLMQMRSVAVGLELEGPIGVLRDITAEIEGRSPFLFVTGASLRSITDGDGSMLRAELRIDGVLRDAREKPYGTSENQEALGATGVGTTQ